VQCNQHRNKVGAIDAAAYKAHSRNRPTAADEKKKSLHCFGCDFSGWYNFGKIINIPDSISAGLRPDPAREIASCSVPPDPLAGFNGPTSNGAGLKSVAGGEEKGRGKAGEGKGKRR